MTNRTSQAYIHTRMRKRTADFLQGMNHPVQQNILLANSRQCSTELDRRMKNESARLLVVAHSECRGRASNFFVCVSQFKSIVDTPFLLAFSFGDMLRRNIHLVVPFKTITLKQLNHSS